VRQSLLSKGLFTLAALRCGHCIAVPCIAAWCCAALHYNGTQCIRFEHSQHIQCVWFVYHYQGTYFIFQACCWRLVFICKKEANRSIQTLMRTLISHILQLKFMYLIIC